MCWPLDDLLSLPRGGIEKCNAVCRVDGIYCVTINTEANACWSLLCQIVSSDAQVRGIDRPDTACAGEVENPAIAGERCSIVKHAILVSDAGSARVKFILLCNVV